VTLPLCTCSSGSIWLRNDYYLGGKDNFAVDREAGDQAIAAWPDIVLSVRANRAFLARVVRFLAGEAGIGQFLDIGTGIPSANNTHEVAQAAAPGTRVVYVDNDPAGLSEAGSRVSKFIQQEQTYRAHEQVLRFFDGLELVEPGLARIQQWRPGSELEAKSLAALWGGVGRKP
jgi:hypothetical protein